MLIGIVFMLYSLIIILGFVVAFSETTSIPFIIFCNALQFITWLMLGLIAMGIL